MKFRYGLMTSLAGILGLSAAESPNLGTISAVNGNELEVSYSGVADVVADQVLVLYGPGALEKHPLTQKVVKESRQFVGKAQVLEVAGGTVRARVFFTAEGKTLSPGFDAIVHPSEASPDAPPVRGGKQAMPTLQVTGGQTIALESLVADPEGGPTGYRWSIEGGSLGYSGVLHQSHGGNDGAQWTAPITGGEFTLRLTAQDRHGQQTQFTQKLAVDPQQGFEPRKALLKPAMVWNPEVMPAMQTMGMANDGTLWAVSADGRSLGRIKPGWVGYKTINSDNLGLVTAMAPYQDRMLMLSERNRSAFWLDQKGVVKGSIGPLRAPTDIAVDSKGTVYVADQSEGGIIVYETSGGYRLKLGMAGREGDGFEGLTELAVDAQDVLYALDNRRRKIQRFDRFHRRLPSWSIPGDPKNPPIDIAPHALGLLVLMQDGTIVIYSNDGVQSKSITSAMTLDLGLRLDMAQSLTVDHAGYFYVTWPRGEAITRYAPDGSFAGIRNPNMLARSKVFGDGQGRIIAYEDLQIVYFQDAEGWRTHSLPLSTRRGGVLERPAHLAVSSNGATLAVVDTRRFALAIFDLTNLRVPPMVIGQRGRNNGQFLDPTAVAVDDAGRVYVSDRDNHSVSVFGRDGSFKFRFGRFDRGRNPDEIINPYQMAVSTDGTTVYVYDYKLYEVQKFTIDHDASQATHVTNVGGKGNSPGQFRRPMAMGCDRNGLLYVADEGARSLQVIDFRGNMAQPIHLLDAEGLGLRGLDSFALWPDGLPIIGLRGALVGLRWKQ